MLSFFAWLAVVATLLLSACNTSRTPQRPEVSRPQSAGEAIARLADYSLWLRRQGPEALDIERARLEELAESADRNLQLALLLGQRGTAFHDPERTARLIMQVITQAPPNSTYAHVAQILSTAQPHPEACADSERLNTLSTQLASQLEDTVKHCGELNGKLETLRQQLETERAERTRLEKQLRALKSLEEQIKDRDEANAQ